MAYIHYYYYLVLLFILVLTAMWRIPAKDKCDLHIIWCISYHIVTVVLQTLWTFNHRPNIYIMSKPPLTDRSVSLDLPVYFSSKFASCHCPYHPSLTSWHAVLVDDSTSSGAPINKEINLKTNAYLDIIRFVCSWRTHITRVKLQ